MLLKKAFSYESPYDPFLWMGFNCVNATEPLRGDSLRFTTKSPGEPGTHFDDLRRIKG